MDGEVDGEGPWGGVREEPYLLIRVEFCCCVDGVISA